MATADNHYWNRIGHIRIQGGDGNMYSFGEDSESLDFKFSVEKKAGDIYTDFTVSILGLTAESVNFLTAWDKANSMITARRIEVYAGYESDGKAPLIARGYVLSAIPTEPPEMWVNMECRNIFREQAELVTEQTVFHGKEKTTKALFFNDVCECLGYEPRLPEWFKKGMNDPVTIVPFVCDKTELLKQASAITGWQIILDGNVATAFPSESWLVCPKAKNLMPTISVETGMIGISNVTIQGMKVKCRLNDQFQINTWVKVVSVLMPKVSGMYYIVHKKTIGHLRGDDWFTELDLLRAQ